MLILSGHGLELQELQKDTAELLRQWRNRPDIQQVMEFQQEISQEMQQQWFVSISNSSFAYFIIYYKQQAIGMIHLSHISEDLRHANVGLFIAEKRFQGTGVALGASLLLLDYAFYDRKLIKLFAKVEHNNKLAKDYNALLGFEFDCNWNDTFQLYKLRLESFEKQKPYLERLVKGLAIS